MKLETIKFSGKKKRSLQDIELGKNMLDFTMKTQSIKGL